MLAQTGLIESICVEPLLFRDHIEVREVRALLHNHCLSVVPCRGESVLRSVWSFVLNQAVVIFVLELRIILVALVVERDNDVFLFNRTCTLRLSGHVELVQRRSNNSVVVCEISNRCLVIVLLQVSDGQLDMTHLLLDLSILRFKLWVLLLCNLGLQA